MMLFIVLVSIFGVCFAELETCERDFAKFGCFKRNKNLFPDMLATNRDTRSKYYIGNKLDWKNYGASLHDLACKCARVAAEGGYQVFAIGFYGECFAGKSKADFSAWAPTGGSNNCIGADYGSCDENSEQECTGGANAEYVYSFQEKAPEKIDGGYTDWSEYTTCSESCGKGFQERERQCTNPMPKNGGKDCEGETSEVTECQIVECPVDGGYTEWEEYSECSASCGGGVQSRTRSCANPSPAHGGKDCEGPATEEQECNTQACPINGEYTEWEEYSECSASCGGGVQSRTRSCTNPSPAHGGKDCEGPATEEQNCNMQECPINGKYTSWGDYSACSVSCGGGIQSKSRSCTNPSPAHGGKDCEGPATEEQDCNTEECPINGGFTEWTAYGSCSASCGGGSQIKTRSCTNPAPQYKGIDCVGSSSQSQECNTHHCPINGGYSIWGEYTKCSKSCGGGMQTRSRTCTNPLPQYNGKDCQQLGSSSETKSCNIQNCPIDGVLSGWSNYGSCSRTCGGGVKTKTRTCTGPFYGGKNCVGSLRQTQSCGTEICLTKSNLETRIKNYMSSHQSKSHGIFRNDLKNSLSSTYPSYYFTVSVYNPCSGWEQHTTTGYSYVAIFRQYGRNVVVTYTKKTSSFPSSSKQTEIKNAVINAITKKGRSAKTSTDLAWEKAKSYGVSIASIQVVRFGNGLRSAVGTNADFQNFVCDRSCNWLNRCTDHESSLVIVFGSA